MAAVLLIQTELASEYSLHPRRQFDFHRAMLLQDDLSVIDDCVVAFRPVGEIGDRDPVVAIRLGDRVNPRRHILAAGKLKAPAFHAWLFRKTHRETVITVDIFLPR